jgi:hypothetical protein
MRSRWLILLVIAQAGCTPRGGQRVEPPALSPSGAAARAMELLDKNKDGFLDAAELERSPALKSSLKEIDQNGDGKLTADEIEKRLHGYINSRIGLVSTSFQVMWNGTPLSGATVTLVTLEPEEFLGPAFKPAIGVSEADGTVMPQIQGGELPGVPCGLYHVRISKVVGPHETIPAKYNSQSILGIEVHPAMRDGPTFELK